MPDRTGEPRPGRDTPEDALAAKRAAQAAARQALAADVDALKAKADIAERQAAIEARATAVAACQLCDTDGYRNTIVCDHQDHRDAARRGMAAIRAALASRAPTPQTNPEKPPTGQPDGKTTPL